jgi:hypothetical protein
MTVNRPRHSELSLAGRIARKRWVPFAASATAVVLTAGAIATAGGGAAGAASAPQAQSVGNFLDAALGGKPIDQLAKLEYATATAPGTTSAQNPLNATVLNAINLPLTGALQFPKLAGADLGVLNQVAVAHKDGSSYGASGAVLNSGGVSIGGNNSAFPDVATVDLCASALSGSACGSGPADAIGELKLSLGAVAGLASTPKGYGKDGSTNYAIAGVNLALKSPLLGQALGTVTGLVDNLVSQLTKALPGGVTLPTQCKLSGDLGNLPLENGAITLDASTGSLTFDLDKLLQQLIGKSLNDLPANTDLISFLLNYLTDPNGLAKGLTTVIDGLVGTLQGKFDACATALNNPVVTAVNGLLGTLTGIVNTLTSQVSSTVSGVVSALGGLDTSTLTGPLAKLLKSVVDIGINVQPNGKAGDFKSGLAATPKQGTAVIAGQTIVRAIEVDLLSGTSSSPAVALALGNAAAGPSTAPEAAPSSSAPSTPVPASSVPATNIPTGVPAGMASHGGSPALPLALAGLALMFAAGGAVAFKMRGRLNSH